MPNGTIINKESLIPIGVALTVGLMIAAGTWKAAFTLISIDYEMRKMNVQLEQTVSKEAFREWGRKLERDNTKLPLIVPEVLWFRPNDTRAQDSQ